MTTAMDHHIATSAVHRCLCPPWLLQHTTVITQTSTRGSSETSCLMTHWIFVLPRWLSGSILFSTFLHWFQSGPITGGKPRPSSPQLPPPAPPRENHGVSGSDGRYNPSAVCWVRLRSSLWLAHAQNSRKDTQEASWCHLLNYLKCPLLM